MTLKRGNAQKAVRRRSSSAGGQETKVARLTRELKEALEQRTAISDILRVISNSPSDVQPVLDSVAEHAARICEAHVVDIAIVDNEVLRTAASIGELGRLSKLAAGPLLGDRPLNLRSAAGPHRRHGERQRRVPARAGICDQVRTSYHPFRAADPRRPRAWCHPGPPGVTEVRPFEEKHIALLTTFADQAAIAIENVRLFEAEQQRTRELTESLEQQTATSEVLQVISSSPGDLQPVFETMVEKAVRICDAKFGNIYRWDGDTFASLARRITLRQPLPSHAGVHRIVPGRALSVAW